MTLDHFRLRVIAYPDERIITGVELAFHRLFEIDTSINTVGCFSVGLDLVSKKAYCLRRHVGRANLQMQP